MLKFSLAMMYSGRSVNPKYPFSRGLVAVALLLAGVGIGGCGSGATAESGQSYDGILRGLKAAALKGAIYNDLKQADDLPSAEREVIRSFCEFAWQITVNREAAKLPGRAYVVNRIRGNAYASGNSRIAPIEAAMGKLHAVVDLFALNGPLLKQYTKACDR